MLSQTIFLPPLRLLPDAHEVPVSEWRQASPSHFPPAAVFENVHMIAETSNDLTVGSAVLPTSPLPPQSQRMMMMVAVLKMAVAEIGCGMRRL